MKNKPILYSFRRCPYAIRARMALVYSGVSVELREVKLSDLPREMLALSPKGTVPVLQLVGGAVLEESLDVIDWVLSINDPNGWLNADDASLIEENDEVFKPLLDRYKYADRNPDKTPTEHREAAMPFLRKLDDRLKQSRYLCSNTLGRTDIAIMPFVRQFAGVDPKWFEHCEFVALHGWLQALLDSELFQSVMHKYPLWQPGEEAIFIPG